MNTHSYTISAEQRNELETLITNGDRVGFYIALHNMTGSEAALDMAEIASSSGLRGGTAWALNSAYADVLDGYPAGGVTAFSIAIAASALDSIEARPDGTYEVPSDIRTYENAKAAWNAVGGRSGVPDLGDKYFPGNIMIAQHHMLQGNPSDAWQAAGMESYIATGAGAGLLFWEALTEIAADGYNHTASLNDFLRQNAGTTVETFTSAHDAHLTVIKDAAGKTIGVVRGDGPLGIAGQFVEGMSSLLRPYADALNALGRWIGQTLPIPHAVDLAVNTQYKSSRI
ncbi:MAG: hypothetical protein C0449_12595, partial [Polaromonas sp.]|nr:hypothetical protein [Polaromonas sp.]